MPDIKQPINEDQLLEVIIEIPAGTRNKYEIDQRGVLHLERQLPLSVTYPTDYGFVPDTLSEDGDALDALVLIDEPIVPGCKVRVVVLGVLWLEDEHGRDPKLITLLPDRAEQESLADISDLPERTLEEIEHFFSVDKDLESGKSSRTGGYSGNRAAVEILTESRARFSKRR